MVEEASGTVSAKYFGPASCTHSFEGERYGHALGC